MLLGNQHAKLAISIGYLEAFQYQDAKAMVMGNIELTVKLQVFTYIHDQRVVHRQFTPDTQ